MRLRDVFYSNKILELTFPASPPQNYFNTLEIKVVDRTSEDDGNENIVSVEIASRIWLDPLNQEIEDLMTVEGTRPTYLLFLQISRLIINLQDIGLDTNTMKKKDL